MCDFLAGRPIDCPHVIDCPQSAAKSSVVALRAKLRAQSGAPTEEVRQLTEELQRSRADLRRQAVLHDRQVAAIEAEHVISRAKESDRRKCAQSRSAAAKDQRGAHRERTAKSLFHVRPCPAASRGHVVSPS